MKTRAELLDDALKRARYVMATARGYVTDFDRDGAKAKRIFDDLVRAITKLHGVGAHDARAVTMIGEIDSILTHKIEPASKAWLEGQIHDRSRSSRSASRRDASVAFALHKPTSWGTETVGTYATRAAAVRARGKRRWKIVVVHPGTWR